MLGMLESGKITAQEAAELLRALGTISRPRTSQFEVKLVRDKDGVKVLKIEGTPSGLEHLRRILPEDLKEILPPEEAED